MPQRLVLEDGEFLKLIVQGHTSAYAMNKILKEQAETNQNQRTMAYKNIIERLTGLVKTGLIEETKEIDNREPSIHGRRDYKVTMDGMKLLISYIMTRNEEKRRVPEEINGLIKYMHKSGVDKKVIGDLLIDIVRSTIESVNHFLKLMELPEIEATLSRKHVISIVDSISVSDSADAKAAHAIRTRTSPSSSKKRTSGEN